VGMFVAFCMFLNHHRFKNSFTNLLNQKKYCEMRREMSVVGIFLACINLVAIRCISQIPSRYDVVIDEIMGDPLPIVGLPNSEFIELKNISANAFDLLHWKITDGSTTATIAVNYQLKPDSFVIICPSSAASAFSAIGTTIGVSNFPSINNDRE